ncbi:hypothetical protein P8936_16055 [Edaphobacter paludis]|uniref:Uncharacterized protein n=1 Tax=Edaphobacter paludis TaxID=3035702 RepID=A0AAU7D780_9BACT
MSFENPTAHKRPWEQRLHEAGTRVEEDLRRFVTYFNDEIVPDVRRNGSEALRSAAAELNRLAQRMDDHAPKTPPPPPPPPPGEPKS